MHYMSIKPKKRITTRASEIDEDNHILTISGTDYVRSVFQVPAVRAGISPTRKYLAEIRWFERSSEMGDQDLIQILDPLLATGLERIIAVVLKQPFLLKGNLLDTSEGYMAPSQYPIGSSQRLKVLCDRLFD